MRDEMGEMGVSVGVRERTRFYKVSSMAQGPVPRDAYKTLHIVPLASYSVFGHHYKPSLLNVSTLHTFVNMLLFLLYLLSVFLFRSMLYIFFLLILCTL